VAGADKVPTFLVDSRQSTALGTYYDWLGRSVGVDDAGNMTAVWSRAGYPNGSRLIFSERFDVNGTPSVLGKEPVENIPGVIDNPAVAVNKSNGDYVVVWRGNVEYGVYVGAVGPANIYYDLPSYIYARLFNSNGNPKGPAFLVSEAPEFAEDAAVAMNRSGEFVVAWSAAPNGNNTLPHRAYVAKFSALGVRQGPIHQIAQGYPDYQLVGAVGIASAGNFVVGWQHGDLPGQIYANCFTSGGESVRGDVQVYDGGTTFHVFGPNLAQGEDGTIAVAYQRTTQDSTGTTDGVYTRLLDAQCNSVGEFTVAQSNQIFVGWITPPAIDSGTGQLAVAWGAYPSRVYDVVQPYVQLFNFSGQPATDPLLVMDSTWSDSPYYVSPGFDGQGNLWALWDASDYRILARSYYGSPSPRAVIVVTPSSESYPATAVGSASLPRTITISNHGLGALSIGTPYLSGPDASAFSVGRNQCTSQLQQASSCALTISFKPSALRGYSATLQIPSNASNGLQAVTLTGQGNGTCVTVNGAGGCLGL
jgi:hypothetical protein